MFIGDTVSLSYTISAIDAVKRQSRADIKVVKQDGTRVAVAQHIIRWVKNAN